SKRDRAAQVRKRALLGNLFRCFQESAPRRPRQRAAHADPPNAKLRKLRDGGEVAPGEDVDRLWPHGLDHGRDLSLAPNTRRVETIGSGLGISRKTADRLREVGSADDKAFRSASQKDPGSGGV